jgi:hypothetical protein
LIRIAGVDHIVLLNTVAWNAKTYTKKEYEQAKQARKLQGIMGYPSTKDFCNMIEQGLLGSCPINKQDILNEEIMFDPNLQSLKVKTIRRGNFIVDVQNHHLPGEIMESCKDVVVCGDVMFVILVVSL